MDNVSDINPNPIIFQTIGLVELFVAIFGAPMNALVLIAAFIRRKGTTFKSRRNITEFLVISMAAADFIFTLFHAPVSFAYFYLGVELSKWQCLFLYTTTHASTIASSFSLLLLNLNKFLQLHRPLQYFLHVTKSRAILCIVIGWTISIGWAVCFVFAPFVEYDHQCNVRMKYTVVYIFFAIQFFLLPTFISLFVSVDLAFVVYSEKKRSRNVSRAPRKCQNQKSPLLEPGKTKRNDAGNVRKISFVFATTLWSAFTILPYRFAYIIDTFSNEKSNIALSVSFCFFGLLALNAAGNPFITLLTHKQYWNQICDRFKCTRNRTDSID